MQVIDFFFHSYSNILDSISQKFNSFEKRFSKIQIFRNSESKIVLEYIFKINFGKHFPKLCYM
jgi:hypothetical protein